MDETNFLHRTRNVYLERLIEFPSMLEATLVRYESQRFHAIFDSAGLRENLTYLCLFLSHTQVSAPTGMRSSVWRSHYAEIHSFLDT